jgi:diaminohydroxyphosphoribosylaminopyrimidine deaminase/5-amino-6-(5-phosphoribosylamino)uracil reductase
MLESAEETPVWLVTGESADPTRKTALEERGAMVLTSPGGIGAALQTLAGQGITRVLVEGGAQVAASLADADLIDEAVIFDGAVEIGTHGVPAGSALAAIRENGAYRRVDQAGLGDDRMTTYLRAS